MLKNLYDKTAEKHAKNIQVDRPASIKKVPAELANGGKKASEVSFRTKLSVEFLGGIGARSTNAEEKTKQNKAKFLSLEAVLDLCKEADLNLQDRQISACFVDSL